MEHRIEVPQKIKNGTTKLRKSYHMDELWEYYAKWNKPGAKRHTLHDYTYMSYLKESNSSKQKIER